MKDEKILSYIPSVIEQTAKGDRRFDIFSRLFRERIIFLGEEIDDDVSNIIVASLLLLDSENPEKDIMLYINSPGGVVTAGLAIYDTIKHIRSDVSTICMGEASSMAALLLSSGTKGKRLALKHSRIMIHQPMGGTRGQASDIVLEAKEMSRLKKLLLSIFVQNTGQPANKIEKDQERDYYMGPEQALEYGIVDRVIGTFDEEAAHRPKPKEDDLDFN